MVCTPHEEHAKNALRVLAARKHVLVEKPMGANVGEALELVTSAQQHKVVLVTRSGG